MRLGKISASEYQKNAKLAIREAVKIVCFRLEAAAHYFVSTCWYMEEAGSQLWAETRERRARPLLTTHG